MRLLITTPTAVIVDDPEVASLRAEDESGSFGILKGHADLLTALTVSVVSWRRHDGRPRHCAVHRGVLSLRRGEEIAIATREAIVGEDLGHLERVVVAEFQQRIDRERTARTETLRLQMKAIRQIIRLLRPDRPGTMEGSS